ncbi:phosphomannomutase/phosphoglucomutase [Ectothiorhodospiraceae bacterium WFHF3C12]|nr:phosphomannomutase/phosphoglucomutase [Ectothiorhodospiraceae bacterium WFHF3C12]
MAEPDLGVKPPIGYALLDMLGEAQRSGAMPPLEMHLPGKPDAHVNLVAPVSDGERVTGHLVLTFPAAVVRRQLALPRGTGAVRLEQRTGGQGIDIVSLGGADGATVRTPVSGAPWTVHYTAPARAYGIGAIDWGAFAIHAGPGVLGLAVVVFGLGVVLRRAVRADASTFNQLLQDLRVSALKTSYPAALSESKPALARAQETARELMGRLREQRRASRRASAEEEEDLAPDIVSGLEVAEEEADADSFTTEEVPAASTPEEPEPEPAAEPVAFDPSILRAYDIRGVVDQTLTADVVRALGQAIGTEAASRGEQRVVVGRDGRVSSPELAEALIEGLTRAGRYVVDIGRVPTPVMYFATHLLETGTGVEITGSHNPADYNGMKIVIGGETLSGEAIQALGTRLETGNLITGQGEVDRRDVLGDYVDRVAQDVLLHRPLKVVVDCGNGVAGEVAPQLLRAIGCEVEELFCEVDGTFPNHHPDPTVPENLAALVSYVRLQEADLGIAFDGDGDRLGVVDSQGKIIWPDRQLMLFSRDVLSRQPGEDIIFDVKCTSALADVITEAAGVPRMWKTGHSLIKAKLKETGAPLAGEMSGHIFFNDRWYGFDDGIYAAARLLELLSGDERSSADVFADLPEAVSTPELRVDLAEGEPARVMDALTAEASFPDARITDIDGLRVDFPDGWALVRASNTQPSLVLRFEGRDEATLERLKGQFKTLLLKAKPDLQLPF